MHEPRVIEVQPPGRVLPPRIEREPVRRLPVAAALIRCSTITTATIIGGTDRRPASSNRSANISSGNSPKHSRCKIP
jgi:hypothetical protein